MRRHLQILAFLAAFAAPCGLAQAQTFDTAKLDSINKAADSFAAQANGSATSGKPPRYTDPAAKPLLDTIFDTKQLAGGKPLPWSDVDKLHDWDKAAMKIGLIYYLAGTGTDDVNVVAKDPKLTLRANQNTAAFAPEFGRYYDAQLQIYSALVDTATAQLAVATPEQRGDPTFKAKLNGINSGVAQSMIGLLHTFALENMQDDWLLLRTVALLDVTPKVAKFMTPEARTQVRNAAVEAAGQIKNPDVQSGVNTVARAFEML
jgi:hypothetical protein